jgi:hypothetical protein
MAMMTRRLLVVLTLLVVAHGPLLLAQYPGLTYFLAATPAQDYQSVLYERRSDGRMDPVRVITPAGTGVHSVLDSDGDAIAELYPSIIPTNITIIHKGDPKRVDDLVVNPLSQFVGDRVTFLRVERPDEPVEALISGLPTP